MKRADLLQNYVDNSLYPIRPLYFGASVAAFGAFYYSYGESKLLALLPSFGESDLAQVYTF